MSLFDLNEEAPSQYSGGTTINMLFKEGVPVRFPKKDGVTNVLVMPAFGPGNTSYVPYRQLTPDGKWGMTHWAQGFMAYELIGGRLNLISPASFDNPVDPVKSLIDVAKSSPEFYHLLGWGADGKKLPWGTNNPPPSLSMAGAKYAMNCVEINPRKPEDNSLSRVFILKQGAIKPASRRNKDGSDSSAWGLIHELNRTQPPRVIEGVNPGDFSHYYYFGDITDPNGLTPCRIAKQIPGSGGGAIWKMEPDANMPLVPANMEMLNSRTPLDKESLFIEPDAKDVIDALVDIYGSQYPQLIRRAFEAQYPGIANMLTQAGVVSHSRVHTPMTPAAPAAAAQPVFAPAAPAQQAVFAPAATAQPVFAPAVPAPAHVAAAAAPVTPAVPAFTPATAVSAAQVIVPVVPAEAPAAVNPASVALTAEQIRLDLMNA